MNTEINIVTVLQIKSLSLFSAVILLKESSLNPQSHTMLRKIKGTYSYQFWGIMFLFVDEFWKKKSLQK